MMEMRKMLRKWDSFILFIRQREYALRTPERLQLGVSSKIHPETIPISRGALGMLGTITNLRSLRTRMAMDSLLFKSHRKVHQMKIASSLQVFRTWAITVLLKVFTNRPRTERTLTLNITTAVLEHRKVWSPR
jgi:hypothetical protein